MPIPNEASFTTLGVELDARGVARVTLAREQTLNAFDEVMIEELSTVFSRCADDPRVRVVVLGAAGRAFSAGADLRWMERASRNTEAENLEDARRFARMMQLIEECPRPVLARVQGVAMGGGVGLCCACDLVVASTHAKFAVSEVRFGILPSVIGPYLTNAVGKRHARRLALSAEQFDAGEGHRIGLVHDVAEPEELDAAVERRVKQLLANGPQALGEVKALFGRLEVGAIDAPVRELTATTIARVRAGDEAREGFAAFLAKRPAAWVAS